MRLPLAALVLSLAPSACSRNDEPAPQSASATTVPAVELPQVADDQRAAVARGINAFAFDLHRRLPSGNAASSPASIAIAFAMTHAGARGETAAEIARVFHFELEGDALHAAYADTLAKWRTAGDGVTIRIANRLFGEQTVSFESDFVAMTDKWFGAPLESVDFRGAPEPARVAINTWVAQQTADRIRDLLPPPSIDATTRIVLVNAVHFDAKWTAKFEREATHDGEFTAAAGRKTTARFMGQTGQLRHAAVDGVALLELPYRGDEFAMVIALPDRDDGLDALEASLDADRFHGWLAALAPARVAVQLPKFVLEPAESLALREHLVALGVRLAFEEGTADLTGIAKTNPPLFLSNAFHKAYVRVDEDGTEAAAATAVVGADGTGAPPKDLVSFHADHPFAFFVVDRRTEAILFLGRVVEPVAPSE